MKTFGEVKEGDYIYYIDHYKLYKQLVTYAKEVEIVSEYKDWAGTYHKSIYKKIIIKAGRGTEISGSPNWLAGYTDFNHYGLHRFASLEAALKYIDEMTEWRKKRYERFSRKAEQEKNIIEKYENIRRSIA